MMHGKYPFFKKRLFLVAVLMVAIAGCSPAETSTPSPGTSTHTSAPTVTATVTPTGTLQPTATIMPSPTRTPDLRLKPEDWQNWPVIPELESSAFEIYRRGQELGRDPHVFSVIGDCQSSPTYFLSIYDEGRYTLPEGEENLQETIDWYAGSFEHRSVTVKNGMTAPGTLNPYWGDPDLCEPKETPIECEIRISNPSLVLISLGTNWNPATSQEDYIAYLNQIMDTLIEQGVLPVLSTKADNTEGDYSRNLAMAQVAYDRHLPLWNFWATVQDLPNTGLDKDRENVYLNYLGWDARNLSALELLDSLRGQLTAVK
jgi:hypothetical protein